MISRLLLLLLLFLFLACLFLDDVKSARMLWLELSWRKEIGRRIIVQVSWGMFVKFVIICCVRRFGEELSLRVDLIKKVWNGLLKLARYFSL